MSLALIVLLPILGAILPALMIRSGRTAASITAASLTTLSLAILLTNAPQALRGETVQASWPWLSAIDLNFSLFVDGLGLLLAGVILSIGLLIILYARFYLSSEDAAGTFLAYLLLFQGAMVGVVLSNNILLLIVFWELTSLSSFLLIGFKYKKAIGRQGARMALTVTAAGGLALLAGFLLLGKAAGTYELTEIIARGDVVRQSPYYVTLLILILLGCFTKSAQFPFHFWLPHAMAAPTPVSAYLHSATMVKAGIFLMARLWPVLSGTPEWFGIVTTVGLFTMLLGAVIALFQDDLKGILAYSTISHLGMLTMLLGLNSALAIVACIFHIINHAIFKASLFMNVGIVDHEVGTRDIKQLGGLAGLMPLTTSMASIAALSMAGMPPFNGFLSKEMMLEEASHTAVMGNGWLFTAAVTLASIFSVAYSLRFLFFTYFGRRRFDYPSLPHDPGRGLWLAPMFLVVMVILIGLFPETWAGAAVRMAAAAVLQNDVPEFHLALWHGWKLPVYLSIAAFATGIVFVFGHRPLATTWVRVAVVDAKSMFDRGMQYVAKSSDSFTSNLFNGSLHRYLSALIWTTGLLGVFTFFGSSYSLGIKPMLPLNPVMLIGWILVVGACGIVVAKHRDRLVALITVNVIGLVSAVAFVYLSAPDLALTQIAVEVVTLILMLLALYFLPKQSKAESSSLRRLRDGGLALAIGLGTGAVCWAMLSRDVTSISNYYLEQAVPGGGGANVVNVILVDFRGFDTFGEITVLGIAAIAIHAMINGMIYGPLKSRLAKWTSDVPKSPNRHPLIMVVITRLMLPLALMVAVFIFLRGHQLPGGGFIGALVVSIALIMQYMASGFGWAEKQVRFDYHALIGGGGLIAAATGIGSMILGKPFLTSGHTHVHFPIIGDVELASAAAFDLGVFLTVVGGVMLALANFSNLGRMTAQETINQQPMDFDPSSPTPPRRPIATHGLNESSGDPTTPVDS